MLGRRSTLTRIVPIYKVHEAAVHRKPGYVAAVFAAAIDTVGERLIIPEKAFEKLRLRFTLAHGPGTELKRILATVGIYATGTCKCGRRAAEMDRRGCAWCEENLDTIVGWLREEAEKRGLPFVDVAGRLIVRRAIAAARRRVGRG
jgi:hypothetical protein